MRKILRPKFWSHGTPLGCLGGLLGKGLPLRFAHGCFLVAFMAQKAPSIVSFIELFFLVAVISRYLWNVLSPCHVSGLCNSTIIEKNIEKSIELLQYYWNWDGIDIVEMKTRVLILKLRLQSLVWQYWHWDWYWGNKRQGIDIEIEIARAVLAVLILILVSC